MVDVDFNRYSLRCRGYSVLLLAGCEGDGVSGQGATPAGIETRSHLPIVPIQSRYRERIKDGTPRPHDPNYCVSAFHAAAHHEL